MSPMVGPGVGQGPEGRLDGQVDAVFVGVAPELGHRGPDDPDVVCHRPTSLRDRGPGALSASSRRRSAGSKQAAVGQAGVKPNATASVPSSSTPQAKVVRRTAMPNSIFSGSDPASIRLAFTTPPPSSSTTDDT